MMTKEEVHQAIDRLNDDQLRPVATLIEELLPRNTASLWEGLKCVPGIRFPGHWPPRFGSVERLRLDGDLASDQLIRDRR